MRGAGNKKDEVIIHLISFSYMREGIDKKQDVLPKRFTNEPLVKGKKDTQVPLDKMLPKYYRLRGWNANGMPTPKTLKKLDLDFVGDSFFN